MAVGTEHEPDLNASAFGWRLTYPCGDVHPSVAGAVGPRPVSYIGAQTLAGANGIDAPCTGRIPVSLGKLPPDIASVLVWVWMDSILYRSPPSHANGSCTRRA